MNESLCEACGFNHTTDSCRDTKAIARWREALKERSEVSALWKRMDERVQRERLAPFVARIAELERERDAARNELVEMHFALDEARETNARLHRRAQGVDARKPEDADLIRRLRADVRGQAKHNGSLIGSIYRMRDAMIEARHDAHRARAKLARIRDELHVRQIIDVIRELRECRAAAVARAEREEADYAAIAEALGCIHHHPHGGHDGSGNRRDLLIAIEAITTRAEAAEALAASRLDVSPEDADAYDKFVIAVFDGNAIPMAVWTRAERARDALRAHAAKVSR